jgi:acetyl-CoA acetyltransferase
VAPPLHKLDIAPDTDGAVAMILASEERGAEDHRQAVWIL